MLLFHFFVCLSIAVVTLIMHILSSNIWSLHTFFTFQHFQQIIQRIYGVFQDEWNTQHFWWFSVDHYDMIIRWAAHILNVILDAVSIHFSFSSFHWIVRHFKACTINSIFNKSEERIRWHVLRFDVCVAFNVSSWRPLKMKVSKDLERQINNRTLKL